MFNSCQIWLIYFALIPINKFLTHHVYNTVVIDNNFKVIVVKLIDRHCRVVIDTIVNRLLCNKIDTSILIVWCCECDDVAIVWLTEIFMNRLMRLKIMFKAYEQIDVIEVTITSLR